MDNMHLNIPKEASRGTSPTPAQEDPTDDPPLRHPLLKRIPSYLHEALDNLPPQLFEALMKNAELEKLINFHIKTPDRHSLASEPNSVVLWSGGGKGLTFFETGKLSSLNSEAGNAFQEQYEMAPGVRPLLLKNFPGGRFTEELAVLIDALPRTNDIERKALEATEQKLFEDCSKHMVKLAKGIVAVAGDYSRPTSILRQVEIEVLMKNPNITHIMPIHVKEAEDMYIRPTTKGTPNMKDYAEHMPLEVWLPIPKEQWLKYMAEGWAITDAKQKLPVVEVTPDQIVAPNPPEVKEWAARERLKTRDTTEPLHA